MNWTQANEKLDSGEIVTRLDGQANKVSYWYLKDNRLYKKLIFSFLGLFMCRIGFPYTEKQKDRESTRWHVVTITTL